VTAILGSFTTIVLRVPAEKNYLFILKRNIFPNIYYQALLSPFRVFAAFGGGYASVSLAKVP
jgi:hypothetical protein